jgi:hypothetical protein
MGKRPRLSFTIENTAKTMLYVDVDDSALPTPLRVTVGAGSFALHRNKLHRVTVDAAPTEAGAFAATITIRSGDPKRLTVSVTVKGHGKK